MPQDTEAFGAEVMPMRVTDELTVHRLRPDPEQQPTMSHRRGSGFDSKRSPGAGDILVQR